MTPSFAIPKNRFLHFIKPIAFCAAVLTGPLVTASPINSLSAQAKSRALPAASSAATIENYFENQNVNFMIQFSEKTDQFRRSTLVECHEGQLRDFLKVDPRYPTMGSLEFVRDRLLFNLEVDLSKWAHTGKRAAAVRAYATYLMPGPREQESSSFGHWSLYSERARLKDKFGGAAQIFENGLITHDQWGRQKQLEVSFDINYYPDRGCAFWKNLERK